MTTLVNLPSLPQELHKVPLPPPTLPELPELPGISDFNQRVELHNQHVQELPLTPEEHLEALLAHIWSGKNLDKVAFTEEHITYCHLRQIDQGTNPHLYTESSLHDDMPRMQQRSMQPDI